MNANGSSGGKSKEGFGVSSQLFCIEFRLNFGLKSGHQFPLRMVEGSAKEQLKEQLKASPSFKAELRDRIKSALMSKVPASQPIQYNFDS